MNQSAKMRVADVRFIYIILFLVVCLLMVGDALRFGILMGYQYVIAILFNVLLVWAICSIKRITETLIEEPLAASEARALGWVVSAASTSLIFGGVLFSFGVRNHFPYIFLIVGGGLLILFLHPWVAHWCSKARDPITFEVV